MHDLWGVPFSGPPSVLEVPLVCPFSFLENTPQAQAPWSLQGTGVWVGHCSPSCQEEPAQVFVWTGDQESDCWPRGALRVSTEPCRLPQQLLHFAAPVTCEGLARCPSDTRCCPLSPQTSGHGVTAFPQEPAVHAPAACLLPGWCSPLTKEPQVPTGSPSLPVPAGVSQSTPWLGW